VDKTAAFRGDRLKMLREEHDWSQRELARHCGFSEAQIGKYESGYSDPAAATLIVIADTLKVSADYLLGRSDIPYILPETSLNDDELNLIRLYRQDSWPGVIKLGAERITK